MELIPLAQTATETAQATKGFDWSTVIPTAIGAVIALAGVGISQMVSYRLKKQELEHQRREANIKRIQDSSDKYLTRLGEIHSLVNGLLFKLERYLEFPELIIQIGKIYESKDSKNYEWAFNMSKYVKQESLDFNNAKHIDDDLNNLAKLITGDLMSNTILFQDSNETIRFMNEANKILRNIRLNYFNFSISIQRIPIDDVRLNYDDYRHEVIARLNRNSERFRIIKVEIFRLHDYLTKAIVETNRSVSIKINDN